MLYVKCNIYFLNAINRFFCNIFVKCYVCMLLKVDINNTFIRILSFSVIKVHFCCSTHPRSKDTWKYDPTSRTMIEHL